MDFELKLGKAASVVFLALAMAGCGGGGSATETPPPPEPVSTPDPAIAERETIQTAIDRAQTAVAAVDIDSTDAEVSAADAAITAARSTIAAATNVPAQERAANTGTVDVLAARLTAAKASRTAAMNDAAKAAELAMAATAMKLHAGIIVPDPGNESAGIPPRWATHNEDAGTLRVQADADVTTLSEDKTALVDALHGWEGRRYTAEPAGRGTYEAIVYSSVGDPPEGPKFSAQYATAFASGVLNEATTEGTASRVASPRFDQSAGTKAFPLPDSAFAITISGSYHGVAGTYRCEPGADKTCAARLAAEGFELGAVADPDDNPATPVVFTAGAGIWTFKPTNPDARLMGDAVYVTYGWWIHKPADDGAWTASAFQADYGAVPAAAGITALRGTATYTGGAAGHYALSSSTGGTNDAGQFTADATLEADFHADTIAGTIDNFTGADGEARDWSVELKTAPIRDDGRIADTDAGRPTASSQLTVWTIDGRAATGSGEWWGRLADSGTDGVPKVAIGTFYSEYGKDGKMVGGFGATGQ